MNSNEQTFGDMVIKPAISGRRNVVWRDNRDLIGHIDDHNGTFRAVHINGSETDHHATLQDAIDSLWELD